MANEEQLAILRQGVEVWNRWRGKNLDVKVDLRGADLSNANLVGLNLWEVNLSEANLTEANLSGVNLLIAGLWRANLIHANLRDANLSRSVLSEANFMEADLGETNISDADLSKAVLRGANLVGADLTGANLQESLFLTAAVGNTVFGNLDLSQTVGLEHLIHYSPSRISMDTFAISKGKIPEVFLRGCGLSDWEIASVKLYNPDLSNEEINEILYKMYDLRATQALQISPLFVSYSHRDSKFVDKVGNHLTEKGIRYWRDIHDMKSGRLEKQIDRAIRQNPTVLLVLSSNSMSSDWVEHEVRTARQLEKDMGRDVLCPVALDDSWKSSRWPKRVMEQIREYNILDFSAWEDDVKFEGMFRKLIDGLELFYKG